MDRDRGRGPRGRGPATGADLTKAATKAHGDGTRPWVAHFYLGHGLGVDAAEMPFVGTDLGDQFDQGLVFEPGNILVLEPIVWEDGTGGYRAEEVMLITDDGAFRSPTTLHALWRLRSGRTTAHSASGGGSARWPR